MKTQGKNPAYHRVIWAIDPFHEDIRSQLVALKSLQCLHPGSSLSIEPVSILHPGKYDLESQNFLETLEELESVAKKNVSKLFKNTSIPGLLNPVFLKQDGHMQTKAVQTLIKYALDQNADEILVSSHARKGTKRALMGSFAETLVLRSPLPTLVVNPHVENPSKVKNILFPTDFTEKSKVAFDRIIDLCRESGTKVLLYHKMQYLYPEFGYPFVVPAVSKDSINALVEKAKDQALEWALEAEKKGVVVKPHISSKPGYALSEIVRTAKKLGKGGVISMASESGPVASVILGSLTRQVLREAPCPVLVLHPHQENLVTKAVEELKHTVYSYGNRPVFA